MKQQVQSSHVPPRDMHMVIVTSYNSLIALFCLAALPRKPNLSRGRNHHSHYINFVVQRDVLCTEHVYTCCFVTQV